MAAPSQPVKDVELSETTPMIAGGEAGNPTYEKVRRVATVALILGALAAAVTFGVKANQGAWVLGTTLLVAAQLFALAKINMDGAVRMLTVIIIANMIYELFLPPYTAAEANPTNKPLQYVPLIALGLGTICFLEYFCKGLERSYEQIQG